MRRNYKRKKFHVSGICIFLETGVRTESWTRDGGADRILDS